MNMKCIVVGVLMCFAIHAVSYAQTSQEKSVKIILSSDRGIIMPCEPLGIVVTLTNQSENAIERVCSHWTSYRVRKEGAGQDWRTYMACGPQPTLMPPRKLKLLSGQSFHDFCLLHVNSQNEPVFKNPGIYHVQAGTPFGESNVIEIKVELPEPSGASVDAVYGKKLFVLFDEYTASCYLQASGKVETLAKDLHEFKQSPSSGPYSGWITVGEYILRKAMIGHEPKSKQSDLLNNVVAEYRNLATELPSPQKESLMIAIAEARIGQSQKNVGIGILQDVINTQGNEYSKVKAQYLRGLYDKK
jgi:hypothetical protein